MADSIPLYDTTSQRGPQLAWRCYQRHTVTSDEHFYKGGDGYKRAGSFDSLIRESGNKREYFLI